MKQQISLLIIAAGLMVGCSEEPPPRSVTEFTDNPSLLEAAMVRCAQDRSGTRYDEDCMNAREAVRRIEAKAEAARKAELEKRSANKRRALRRTQEAAAAARRRAAEAVRVREEAEYLAQFGVGVDAEAVTDAAAEKPVSNTPQAVIPEAAVEEAASPANSPEATPSSDLDAVRDELRRRNEEPDN